MTDTRDHHGSGDSTSYNSWNTQYEKYFLDGLGQWTVGRNFPPRPGRSRLKYLVGYRDSIPKRVNWVGIDRNEIIDHLNIILIEYGIPPLPLITKEDEAELNEAILAIGMGGR